MLVFLMNSIRVENNVLILGLSILQRMKLGVISGVLSLEIAWHCKGNLIFVSSRAFQVKYKIATHE